MRARVFRRDAPRSFHFAGELEAEDADDIWRQAESGVLAGEPLGEGDVVYVGDIYFQLDGDGGWRPVRPSALTRKLYDLATTGKSDR